ncbi:MAG TPA: hypothetical protein PKM54_07770 [Anaerolineales bacterium]|nr:hypothetical protein [Anaerolineales bacterium]
MRPFEIVIPILLAIYLFWPNPRPLLIRLAPAFALAATLIHFTFEGYRWQMIPLYVLSPILAASGLIKFTKVDSPSFSSVWKERIGRGLTLGLLAVSTVIPALLPVPQIPTPSGSLKIGTVIYEFTDTSRTELYSDDKSEPRRFMVQAWYPATPQKSDQHAQWMSNAETFAPAISGYLNLPSFFLDHLALVNVPAYENAQAAKTDTGYPIIVFSHGWNGFNAQNTGQVLELASRGYVVIAVQHTYGAVVTVFPDGTVAPNNPQALPEDANDPNYEVVARKLVNQWAGDISFTLDQFAGQNQDSESIFFQTLDLSRVGVYGHSTGGGAAIQFCGTDPRCKTILGMDPFMRPVSEEVLQNGLSQPSFFMFSQGWADVTDSKNNQLFNQFQPNLGDNRGIIVISGTKHFDFSDLPLLSPIAPQLGLKGPLNGGRVVEIVNSYLLGFFEMTLKNQPSELFNGNFADFNEVKERNQ